MGGTYSSLNLQGNLISENSGSKILKLVKMPYPKSVWYTCKLYTRITRKIAINDTTAGSAESNAWGDENKFSPMNQESHASKAFEPDATGLCSDWELHLLGNLLARGMVRHFGGALTFPVRIAMD